MWVLTMNTGELRQVPARATPGETNALRTAFATRKPIAGHPDYHVECGQWAGGCMWKLFFRGEAVFVSFLAWNQVGNDETWKRASLYYEEASEFIDITDSRPRKRPKELPWLAVVILLMPDNMSLADSPVAGHVNLLLADTLVQESRQSQQRDQDN